MVDYACNNKRVVLHSGGVLWVVPLPPLEKRGGEGIQGSCIHAAGLVFGYLGHVVTLCLMARDPLVSLLPSIHSTLVWRGPIPEIYALLWRNGFVRSPIRAGRQIGLWQAGRFPRWEAAS